MEYIHSVLIFIVCLVLGFFIGPLLWPVFEWIEDKIIDLKWWIDEQIRKLKGDE